MDSLQPTGPYTDLHTLVRTRLAARDLRLPAKVRSQSLMHGSRRTQFRGRGMEFAEIRPYQAGDDVRTIDWRVTAKAQKPFTKLYSEEREKPVFFLVDQRASMFFGSQTCFKSVFAAQLACQLGWAASLAGDRIGAMIAHSQGAVDLRPKGRQHAMLSFINQLHHCNTQLQSPIPDDRELPLSQLLGQCRRALKPGSTLVIISDFADWTEDCKRLLSLLGRHNDALLLHLYDRLEQQPPTATQLALTNGLRAVDLDTARSREIAQAFRQHSNTLAQAAQGLGCAYHQLECSTPLTPWLQQHFGRAKRTSPQHTRTSL